MSYLTPFQKEVVHAWRRALDPPAGSITGSEGRLFAPLDRGHRARLRRAASLADLEQEESVFRLRERLGPLHSTRLEQNDQPWLCLLAGAVALVKDDDGTDSRSLAARVGEAAKPPGGSAPLSEMRFRRLMRAQTPEEFFLQLRRALPMVSGRLNVAELAEDILAWSWERGRSTQTAYSMRYRWARDYFLTPKDLPIRDATPDLTPENPR